MLRNPVLVLVLLGALALVLVMIRSAWRNRSVSFIHSVTVLSGAATVSDEIFDRIVPVLVKDSYRTVAQAGHTTAFERRSSTLIPLILAIVLFPFGLIALFGAGARETITVVSGESGIDLHGRCRKPIADYLIAVADNAAAAARTLPA